MSERPVTGRWGVVDAKTDHLGEAIVGNYDPARLAIADNVTGNQDGCVIDNARWWRWKLK
jgi:hypothetical protein